MQAYIAHCVSCLGLIQLTHIKLQSYCANSHYDRSHIGRSDRSLHQKVSAYLAEKCERSLHQVRSFAVTECATELT
jgi:hypothetical protein